MVGKSERVERGSGRKVREKKRRRRSKRKIYMKAGKDKCGREIKWRRKKKRALRKERVELEIRGV